MTAEDLQTKQVQEWLDEIQDRCRKQNIDTNDCYIMFTRNQTWFGTENVKHMTESKDGRWVCIPLYDEEESEACDSYVYTPRCFEVKAKFTTYLSNGFMNTLTTVWLLYK